MTESTPKWRMLAMSAMVADNHQIVAQAKDTGLEIVYPPDIGDRSEVAMLNRVKGIHATLAGGEVYSEAVIAASSLKVISRIGAGYDAIDVGAATAHGVAVCASPGTNADSVADHAFGLILALARQIVPLDHAMKSQVWSRPQSVDVWGQTIGVLGLGRIGKCVARRARGFNMRIVAFDQVWDDAFAEEFHVERASLVDVLREADFLTIHLPSTPETHHLVNAERLAHMKPTAFLVNAARGAIVDQSALYDTLKARRIAGAALDVFEREPLGASPLINLDNVVLTPHSAYFSPNSNKATMQVAFENALLVLQGKRPHYCVNPEVLG